MITRIPRLSIDRSASRVRQAVPYNRLPQEFVRVTNTMTPIGRGQPIDQWADDHRSPF
jgi:hypothetical protein